MATGWKRHAVFGTLQLAFCLVTVNLYLHLMRGTSWEAGFTLCSWIVLLWLRPWAVSRPGQAAAAGVFLLVLGMVPWFLTLPIAAVQICQAANQTAFGLTVPWLFRFREKLSPFTLPLLVTGWFVLILQMLREPRFQTDTLPVALCAVPLCLGLKPLVTAHWSANIITFLRRHSLTVYCMSFLPAAFSTSWPPAPSTATLLSLETSAGIRDATP